MMRPKSALDHPQNTQGEHHAKLDFVDYRRRVVTALYAAAPQTSGGNKDEQEIRALEDRFAAAFRAKDVPAIMKGYAPGNELFVFDVFPPRQ